jgi:hypothetical protein
MRGEQIAISVMGRSMIARYTNLGLAFSIPGIIVQISFAFQVKAHTGSAKLFFGILMFCGTALLLVG